MSPVDGSFQGAPGSGFGSVIGVGDASPWVVGTNSTIFHYNNDAPPPRAWIQEPNSSGTSSLAVSPEGTVWKIDNSGNVAARTGPGTWQTVGSGFLAYEIGVGSNGVAWAISRTGCSHDPTYPYAVVDCPIYRWAANQWAQYSGAARHVAVAPHGTAYVTNSNGTIFKFNGSSWVVWPGTGCARNKSNGDTLGWPVIGAASVDSVWVLGCPSGGGADAPIYSWLPQVSAWQQISGAASTLSVGADGTPWVINSYTDIYEYVTSWQPMGPFGFSFVDSNNLTETWSGELHDVAIPTGGGSIVVGATGGGVWEHLLEWAPIADVGAGVTAQGGQARAPGPNMSIGSVAIKPNDAQTVVVGTGVAGSLNNSTNSFGNGIWYTHNALTSPQTWAKAATDSGDPQYVVKVRYSADSSKIYAATSSGIFIGAETNGIITFTSAGTTCRPGPNHAFTDLVVDPANANTFYAGVANEGVYQSTNGGAACTTYVPGPLYSGGGASSITAIALAMTSNSTLYASVAGTGPGQGNDFQGIFSATGATLPNWTTPVPGGPAYPFLRSQGNHDWALTVDSGGTTIIAAGVHPWRFPSCSPTGCASGADVGGGHGDVHAMLWGSDGVVYLVSDGGLFTSSDGGATWQSDLNRNGVANEVHVFVDPNSPSIFASAWDVGLNYLDKFGQWKAGYNASLRGNFILDGHQAVIDPQNTNYVYACGSPGDRYVFNGSGWASADNPQILQSPPPPPPCNFAVSTNSVAYPSTIYNNQLYYTPDHAQSWYPYAPLPGGSPWYIARGNDSSATMYVAIAGQQWLTYSDSNGAFWSSASVPPSWNANYQIGSGDGTAAGAAMALDPITGDVYLVGERYGVSPLVSMSSASSHGTSWSTLTGWDSLELNQNELVNTLAVDSSTRSVIVGTEGRAGSGIYRLNNPDVAECTLCTASHHWRPWVNGLPNAEQPVKWLTGQYENGIFYYYAATWGRGIWKREARGGDF